MGLFEFLMILMSVVIGLALTEVLTGAASLMRARSSVEFHWLHVLFQVGVFFALLQQWWESWHYVDVGEISFGLVLSILFPSLMLFLIAHLLYPRPAHNANLRDYYYAQAPVLWTLVLLGTFQGTFIAPLLRGDPILETANLSGIPMSAVCLVLIVSKNRWAHSILSPMVMLLVILDTWLVTPTITAAQSASITTTLGEV